MAVFLKNIMQSGDYNALIFAFKRLLLMQFFTLAVCRKRGQFPLSLATFLPDINRMKKEGEGRGKGEFSSSFPFRTKAGKCILQCLSFLKREPFHLRCQASGLLIVIALDSRPDFFKWITLSRRVQTSLTSIIQIEKESSDKRCAVCELF